MTGNNTLNKKRIDIVSVIIVFVIVALLGSWLILKPENAVSTIAGVQGSAIKILTPFYLWLG